MSCVKKKYREYRKRGWLLGGTVFSALLCAPVACFALYLMNKALETIYRGLFLIIKSSSTVLSPPIARSAHPLLRRRERQIFPPPPPTTPLPPTHLHMGCLPFVTRTQYNMQKCTHSLCVCVFKFDAHMRCPVGIWYWFRNKLHPRPYIGAGKWGRMQRNTHTKEGLMGRVMRAAWLLVFEREGWKFQTGKFDETPAKSNAICISSGARGFPAPVWVSCSRIWSRSVPPFWTEKS